jgi:hypothetical protein
VSDRSNFVEKPDGDNILIILNECQRSRYFRSGTQSTQLHTNNVTRTRRYIFQCFFLVEISVPQENIVRFFMRYDSLRHYNGLYLYIKPTNGASARGRSAARVTL